MPIRFRRVWLLIASYYFYMSWNPQYAVLIFFSTIVTYIVGMSVGKATSTFGKKVFLISGIAINLVVLFIFKYANFFVENMNRLFAKSGMQLATLDVLLPVGISFYTFQVIGYLMDVYRGDTKAEKNFIKYALFVSFFPQLVAGPIERSSDLLAELEHISVKKRLDYQSVTGGLTLMVYGMFLKVVLSDRIMILVDYVFANYLSLGGIELLLGAVAFSIQIYCDFSGYSLIAVGAARVLGVQLMENFSTPYFARSIKEFWRRWHISLSTWFRDYLYIPMGGNKCSELRNDGNIMVTFLLSGLWHGASWNFVVWGGLHGLYQVIGKRTAPLIKSINRKEGIKEECFSYKLLQTISTYLLVVFAWIFFRADTLGIALQYIMRIFKEWNFKVLFTEKLYTLGLNVTEMNILFIALLVLLVVDCIKYLRGLQIDEFLEKQNLWFRWVTVIGMITMIIMVGKYGPGNVPASFIYFQF